jgi:Domain of unknown function (DUF4124)/Bacterial Ig domain
MRAMLFTLLSVVACTVTVAATVYRWVDENGVTHYSDQPHENAEKVTVASPQTYSATRGYSSASAAAPKAASATYSCTVAQPANDATFQNTSTVSFAAQASPAPANGDQMVLLLDGAKVPNFPSSGGSVTLDSVDRGQHTVQAVVQDSSGKAICQSTPVTFTVLQASVLNPANPNHRH